MPSMAGGGAGLPATMPWGAWLEFGSGITSLSWTSRQPTDAAPVGEKHPGTAAQELHMLRFARQVQQKRLPQQPPARYPAVIRPVPAVFRVGAVVSQNKVFIRAQPDNI